MGFRVWGLGFGVLGFRVWGFGVLGLEPQALGFWGLGFGVLAFGVLGFGDLYKGAMRAANRFDKVGKMVFMSSFSGVLESEGVAQLFRRWGSRSASWRAAPQQIPISTTLTSNRGFRLLGYGIDTRNPPVHPELLKHR